MFNEKLSWRQPAPVLLLVAILVFGAIVVASILREWLVNEQQWQVSVSGQGRANYQPDIANVNLGMTISKAASAEDALKQLNDKMNKTIDAIKRAGIAPEDIQTQNYTLSPHYDSKDNITTLTGYDANQNVVIKVRDIMSKSDFVAKVLSAAAKAGSNQINGITFENSKINEIKQEARLKAIADARAKSSDIATALGVKLGKVVGWWENIVAPSEAQISYKGDLGMGGGIGGGGSEPVIPSGTQELIIEVNISYKIK
jgi:uncharacterized protein YggE